MDLEVYIGMRYDFGGGQHFTIAGFDLLSEMHSPTAKTAAGVLLAGNSPDTRCHGGSRLPDPFNAGHAMEACRSEVSFDPDGCGSEIAMRRLLASERMLDGGVGAGRAGVVAHTSCQRRVSHSSCSRPVVGCHRMRTCVHCKPRNHGRATPQRMSLRAATHSGSAFTHRYRTAR